jgi:hypothetical protein
MGGRGSGRPAGLGLMTAKTHELRSIDLVKLHRDQCLSLGTTWTITWSRRGEITGSIGARRTKDGLRLNYRTRRYGEDWRDIDELIPLVSTPTQFGGRRLWFRCTSCARRCRILYGGTYFRCRRCHGLKYESQYEPAIARAASAAQSIRRRLGGTSNLQDPFPDKSKGMHWKTYRHLRSKADNLEHVWASAMATHLGLLLEHDTRV